MKVDLSKVKVGDKIWTIHNGYTIVLNVSKIEDATYPIVTKFNSYSFNGKVNKFHSYPSAFLEYPFKEQPIEKDTLVYYRDSKNHCWAVGYYSHFENGKHFVFNGSRKSTQESQCTFWRIVTTENPLL